MQIAHLFPTYIHLKYFLTKTNKQQSVTEKVKAKGKSQIKNA